MSWQGMRDGAGLEVPALKATDPRGENQRFPRRGKSAINLNNLGNLAKLDPKLCIYVGPAASKMFHFRPVGGPENTCNKGEKPNINHVL